MLELIAQSWAINHPTYVSQITSPQDMRLLATELKDYTDQLDSNKQAKRKNTRELGDINKLINKEAQRLCKLIRAYHLQSPITALSTYGILLHTPSARETYEQRKKRKAAQKQAGLPQKAIKRKRRFIIPYSNVRRAATLSDILYQLQQPNNPIMSCQSDNRYIQKWLDLQSEHARHWADCQRLKSAISASVVKAAPLKAEAMKLLHRLSVEIKNFYGISRTDGNGFLRSFGYLAERQ